MVDGLYWESKKDKISAKLKRKFFSTVFWCACQCVGKRVGNAAPSDECLSFPLFM